MATNLARKIFAEHTEQAAAQERHFDALALEIDHRATVSAGMVSQAQELNFQMMTSIRASMQTFIEQVDKIVIDNNAGLEELRLSLLDGHSPMPAAAPLDTGQASAAGLPAVEGALEPQPTPEEMTEILRQATGTATHE